MYLTLPWFIGLVFFCCAGFFWAALEIGGLHRRIEQIDYDLDRWRDAQNARLERAEDWITKLIDDVRHQAGAVPRQDPATVPTPVQPATQPDLKQAAKVPPLPVIADGDAEPWPKRATQERRIGKHTFRFATEETSSTNT